MTRWRAEFQEKYYYVDEFAEANFSIDLQHDTDNRRHEAGNYFETRDEAEEVAAQFRSILKQKHKDLELVTQ